MREGTHDEADDRERDAMDCSEDTAIVYYTPGVDEIKDCKILNPPQ